MFWDNLSYQWDLRVLSFNDDAQHAFLASLGLGELHWDQLTVGLVVAASSWSRALALWLARPRGEADPAAAALGAVLPAHRGSRSAARGCGGTARLYRARGARISLRRRSRSGEIGRLFAAPRYGRSAKAEIFALRQAIHRIGSLRARAKTTVAQAALIVSRTLPA